MARKVVAWLLGFWCEDQEFMHSMFVVGFEREFVEDKPHKRDTCSLARSREIDVNLQERGIILGYKKTKIM